MRRLKIHLMLHSLKHSLSILSTEADEYNSSTNLYFLITLKCKTLSKNYQTNYVPISVF